MSHTPASAYPELQIDSEPDFGGADPTPTPLSGSGQYPSVPIDMESFLARPERPDELGRLGGYRILKLLGEGGMGYVFLAEDESLQRPVALKVMKPEVVIEKTSRERFFREARAAAKVRHDNVVTIHQVGEDRGLPFLAMEHLEGLPLDQFLKKCGEVTLNQAIRICKEIAVGLQAAHRQGLIHRDIKPANVWLEGVRAPCQGALPQTAAFRVKILDFGLARHEVEDTHLTRTGEVVGTPAFMSPEQARDQPIDGRSDLFSLGIILYRLCTGQLPFTGATTMAVLTSLAVDEPMPPSELNRMIPIYLQEVILRLLEKKTSKRYQSAEETVEALTGIENRAGVASRIRDVPYKLPPIPTEPPDSIIAEVTARTPVPPPTAVEPAAPKPRPSNLLFVGAGFFGVLVAFFVAVVYQPDRRGDAANDTAGKNKILVKEKPKSVGMMPAFAHAPFDARHARGYQESWGKYLDQKVEIENSIGMPLTLIPPSKFLMGTPENDAAAPKNELPQHEVEITKPFYLGIVEVTQDQYEAVMKANPSKFRREMEDGLDYPVENISWDEAHAFCEELNKLPDELAAGRTYRLPTEAEWECACRAGTHTPTFHDARSRKEFAWQKDNADGKPHAVRQLQPNPWGLYDMTGNVWEWCADYFDETYYARGIGKDPTGPPAGNHRVMRGGSWGGTDKTCRSAYRFGLPASSKDGMGFRVCFTVKE